MLSDHSRCFVNGGSLTTLLIKKELKFENPLYPMANHYYELTKYLSKPSIELGSETQAKKLSRGIGTSKMRLASKVYITDRS